MSTSQTTTPPESLGSPFCCADEWLSMSACERNLVIAKVIGAELLGQFYVYAEGRQYCATPLWRDKVEEAANLESHMRGKGWKTFAKDHGFQHLSPDQVELRLCEWAMRYSDTPGGGWEVIEWLKKKCEWLWIGATEAGWEVAAVAKGDEDFTTSAATMAEAACLMALELFRHNTEGQTAETE
jgi:hypothetical protein